MADNMSFLPEDYVEKRAQRRTNFICLTLFVVVMIGVAGAFFVTDRQRTEVRDLQMEVNNDFEEAAERIEKLETLQERKQEMIRKAKITSVLIERIPRSIILAELINNMPGALSLVEFELETKVIRAPKTAKTALDKAKEIARKKRGGKDAGNLNELAEPEVQNTEVKMIMEGVAPTDVQVAQFMTALGRSELFTEVGLIFSEQVMIEDQEMRKFRVELALNQEVDLSEEDPQDVQKKLQHNPMAETINIDVEGNLVTPDNLPAELNPTDTTASVPTVDSTESPEE